MTPEATLANVGEATEQDGEDRVLVSQPDDAIMFYAMRSELRLIKTPRRPIRGPDGESIDETRGVMVQFHDGVLRIPTDGTDVTLGNGDKEPVDNILPWLESHRLFKDKHEGFWRADPAAPPPSMAELTRLQEFALALDVDGLEAFLAQEEGGWNRPELVEIAKGTLERIEAAKQTHEDELARAREEGKAEGRGEAKAETK